MEDTERYLQGFGNQKKGIGILFNEKMGRAGADESGDTWNWLWNTQVHAAYQIKVRKAGVVQEKFKHVQCC